MDDDPAQARHLAKALRQMGHTPTMAHDWTSAIRLFKTGETVDLVLMDAVMPVVDGFKLTQMLRKRSRVFVPIVFVTALADERSRRMGVGSGADDVLAKPVETFELKMRVAAMLRIRKLAMELEARHARLAELAHSDALTGLHNRRAFDERLAGELERAERYARPLGLMVIDVDRFKRVNDDLGHAVGDALLRRLGKLLSEQVRAPDSAFRYGGEEFVVLTPETDAHGASRLAERLRTAFPAASAETEAGRQTISLGVAASDALPSPVTTESLFRAADEALYRAKESGRDRVEVAKAYRLTG